MKGYWKQFISGVFAYPIGILSSVIIGGLIIAGIAVVVFAMKWVFKIIGG